MKTQSENTEKDIGRKSEGGQGTESRGASNVGHMRIGRRKLLALAGIAGVSAAAGALLNLSKAEAKESSSVPEVMKLRYPPGQPMQAIAEKLAEWVSVKDYGAMGDGVTNDTAAIQRAFDNTGASGAVFFPAGTYLISPVSPSDYILSLRNKVTFSLCGQGDCSVIKVAGGSGNYKGIIGLANTTAELAGFQAECLAFDHNRQNNVLPSVNDYQSQLRSTISNYSSATGYGQISIRNCTIRNADGVVSLYFPKGIRTGNLVKISGCSWISAGNGNGNDFDQSFINATCDSLNIANCTFEGASWSDAPRTAIETHSSNCVVTGNTISKFQIGMNLTGISQSGTTVNQVCSSNTIDSSRDGILIWSQSLAPANASVGFQNMLVSGNIVNLNPYHFNFNATVGGCRGISIYGGSKSVSYENLTISGNTIRYEREVGSPYIQKFALKSFGAIGSYENGNQGNLAVHFSIRDNTIVNCPSSGIFFDLGKAQGLTIANNELIDCGTTISSSAQFSNKVPIYLATSLESDCIIADNVIRLSDAAPTVTDFIFVRNRANNGCYYKCVRNTFVLRQGVDLTHLTDYVGVYNASQRLLFEGSVPLEAIRLPAIAGSIGSRVTFEDSGRVATKTNASTNWRKEGWDSAPPTSGTWNQGDIVYHAAPAPAGPTGWICTTSGTPGVWKDLGTIEA